MADHQAEGLLYLVTQDHRACLIKASSPAAAIWPSSWAQIQNVLKNPMR